MDTCGKCEHIAKGKCILSGWYGCSDSDLATVKDNEVACESFEEKQ